MKPNKSINLISIGYSSPPSNLVRFSSASDVDFRTNFKMYPRCHSSSSWMVSVFLSILLESTSSLSSPYRDILFTHSIPWLVASLTVASTLSLLIKSLFGELFLVHLRPVDFIALDLDTAPFQQLKSFLCNFPSSMSFNTSNASRNRTVSVFYMYLFSFIIIVVSIILSTRYVNVYM